MAKNLPDSFIRRQFYITGFGNQLGDEFVTELNKSNATTYALLLEMLPEIIGTRPLTRARADRLERLGRLIADERGTYIDRFRRNFEKELDRIVALEFAANTKEFRSIPLYEEIEDDSNYFAFFLLLMANGSYDGQTVDQWFQGFKEGDAQRIKQQAAIGINNGLKPEEIARSIVGTKSQGYADGIVSQSQNSARTLARTVTTGITNQSRKLWSETTGANMRRLSGAEKKGNPILLEVFSAILDSRTTFLCASLSGNIYPVGQGYFPPLHKNCRSSRYPIPFELAHPDALNIPNFDFSNAAKRRIGREAWDMMNPAQHATEILEQKKSWLRKNVGRLPEEMGFTSWFNDQPVKFQRDYLGPNRYARWKTGDLDIGDFVAPDGAMYTIDQLVSKGIL